MTRSTPTLPRLWLAPLCAVAFCGAAQAQDAPPAPPPADEGIIDLTPLLGDAVRNPAAPAGAAAPADAVAVPVLTDPVLPAYRRGAATTGSVTGPDAATPVTTLFHPAHSDGGPGLQRVSGEYAELALTVTVPPGAVAETLSITYRNSINVLPDTSRMTATLDGAVIGDWPLAAPGDFETVTLPATALRPGPNRIVLQAVQAHRIFCGPEASFAIWTDVAPARSGITLAADAVTADAEGFRLAAAAELGKGRGLPLVAADPVSADLTDAITQRLTGIGADRTAGVVARSPYAPVAAQGDLARIAVLPAAALGLPPSEPGYARAPDGAIVMVLPDTIAGPQLDLVLPPAAAVVAPTALVPGQDTRLADLSDAPLDLRSRYARAAVAFRLPDDWLLLSSQKARMTLIYRYAAGLPDTALMLVKVNETTVRLLPLATEGNTALPPLDVGFPARLLQPGMNSVSFEAIIPGDPADLPCPPVDTAFVEISGDTTLAIPPSPAMQFPRVARSVQALTPEAIRTAGPGAPSARAAAVQRALAVALPPLDLPRPRPATLTVTALESLDPADLVPLGLDRATVGRALAPPRDDGPVAAPQGDTGFAQPAPEGPSLLGRLTGRVQSVWDRLRHMAWPGDPVLAEWLSERSGVALLTIPDPARPQEMWLLIGTGADPAMVATAMAEGRVSPAGPTGQAALLSDGGTWQNWRPAKMPPGLNEPLGLRNFRVVAGNYASWSPLLFTGILAFLMSVSVLLALRLIVKTRGARMR